MTNKKEAGDVKQENIEKMRIIIIIIIISSSSSNNSSSIQRKFFVLGEREGEAAKVRRDGTKFFNEHVI